MSFDYKSNYDMAKSLNELRHKNTDCDVILQVGQRSFLAHRIVLMSRLEYFRTMLTIDMREKNELILPLEPTIIDPDIFEEILECIYTSKLAFTAENFKPICKAADYLCFDELLENAENYVKSSIKTEETPNLSLRAIISSVGDESLQEECHQLLLANPSSVIARKLLIPVLTIDNLKTLLKRMNDLSRQEDMFHYCVDWIEQDVDNRSDKLPELMASISFGRMSRKFLKETVYGNALVCNDNSCLKSLVDALSEEKPKETVYVVGGRDNEVVYRVVSKFNPIKNQWKSLAGSELPVELEDFGLVVVGDNIYVCGGSKTETESNRLFVYNCGSKEWKSLKPMRYFREGCGMAYHGGYLYVAGGTNGNQTYSQMERYSIEINQWQDMAPMAQKRGGMQLVQMNGYLYAIGGKFDGEYRDTAERYDPLTDRWQPIANTNHSYAYFGAEVLQDCIFIVGADSFEKYDASENQWNVMPYPSECYFGRRLATLDGKLYVFGGALDADGFESGIASVEYFDFVRNAWFAALDMDFARYCHGVAVVKSDS